MKFAHELASALTSEWRSQYLRYDDLKELLYQIFAQHNAPPPSSRSRSRQNSVAAVDRDFFEECEDELDNIRLFYNQKAAEADYKFRELCSELANLKGIDYHDSRLRSVSIISTNPHKPLKKRKRVAFSEDGDEHIEVVKPRTDSMSTIREKLDDLTSRIRNISVKNDHKHHIGAGSPVSHFHLHPAKVKHSKTTKRQLEWAFSEFYLFLVLIQRFQELNVVGLRKITKKHDKLMETEQGREWYRENVIESDFGTDRHIDLLIEYTEKLYVSELTHGSRLQAIKRLRVPPLCDPVTKGTSFRVGFLLGAFIVLCWSIADTLLHTTMEYVGPHIPLFRGLFILYLMVFLVGVNAWGWRANGVNHILIFEIDPRCHISSQALMSVGLTLMNLWAMCLLGYLHAEKLGVNRAIFPVILVCLSLVYFLLLPKPLSMLYWKSKGWLLNIIKRCLAAPFYSVNFADFWLGDQMTSLLPVFQDIDFLICYFITIFSNSDVTDDTIDYDDFTTDEPIQNNTSIVTEVNFYDVCSVNWYGIRSILTALPYWIRAMQCLRRYYDSREKHPHLTNFGKYSTAFLVVGAGLIEFQPWMICFWIAAQLISNTYKCVWDILMDWGLLDKSFLKPKRNRFLREELIYRHHWYYYAAIVSNAILRYTWTLQHWLNTIIHKEIVTFILGILEAIRRFVWNYFRLENEHLNNCGQFRVVRDISLKPLNRKTGLQKLGTWASALSLRSLRKETSARPSISSMDLALPKHIPRRELAKVMGRNDIRKPYVSGLL